MIPKSFIQSINQPINVADFDISTFSNKLYVFEDIIVKNFTTALSRQRQTVTFVHNIGESVLYIG